MLRIGTLFFVAAALIGGCQNTGPDRLASMRALDVDVVIPIADALAIAQQEVEGFPVEVELELEDDDGEAEPPAWEVVVFVPDAMELWEVEIHAVTGEVLEVELEEDEAEAGDDD